MVCDPWPILWPCNSDGDPEEPDADPTQIAAAVAAAQAVLWQYTGRVLGVCTFIAHARFDQPDVCLPGVAPSRTIVLARTPVQSIIEVVTGAGSTASWSLSGSVVTVNTAASEVEVSYRAGQPLGTLDEPAGVTSLVAAAMGELATEILKGMCGSTCKIPARASTIARAGVTVNTVEPERMVELGLLGLKLCDRLIRSVNPHQSQSPSLVMSVDAPRA